MALKSVSQQVHIIYDDEETSEDEALKQFWRTVGVNAPDINVGATSNDISGRVKLRYWNPCEDEQHTECDPQ